MSGLSLAGTRVPDALRRVVDLYRAAVSLSRRGVTAPGRKQARDRKARMSVVPLGVFLLDAHEVVRAGLHALLEAAQDIDVVGGAGTVADAPAALPAATPDVAVGIS